MCLYSQVEVVLALNQIPAQLWMHPTPHSNRDRGQRVHTHQDGDLFLWRWAASPIRQTCSVIFLVAGLLRCSAAFASQARGLERQRWLDNWVPEAQIKSESLYLTIAGWEESKNGIFCFTRDNKTKDKRERKEGFRMGDEDTCACGHAKLVSSVIGCQVCDFNFK